MLSIRDQIFAADDLEREELFIMEWGAAVVVQGFTAAERERWEKLVDAHREAGTLRAMTATIVCRDKAGALIFEPGDVDRLNAKGAGPLGRIWDSVIRLSAVSKEDVDTLEGN